MSTHPCSNARTIDIVSFIIKSDNYTLFGIKESLLLFFPMRSDQKEIKSRDTVEIFSECTPKKVLIAIVNNSHEEHPNIFLIVYF